MSTEDFSAKTPGGADAEPVVHLQKYDLIPDHAISASDDDRFGYSEVAAIVADLAAQVELPCNIALFGPWGSGKSSLFPLIETHLNSAHEKDDQFPNVKAVRYDAWKFSGSPLHRTFLRDVAERLGQPKDGFSVNLYSDVTSVGFDPKKLRGTILPLLGLFAFAGLVVTGLYELGREAAVAIGSGAFEGSDVWNSFLKRLPSTLAATTALATAAGVLDAGKATITRRAPAEVEQFIDLFQELMDAVKTPKDGEEGVERVLVFVDELDRCTPHDVLETLIGIKTFLEHDDCVFVVAADRDVLVEALNQHDDDARRQATPARKYEPYYATAGAFLDKMFQHQLELPSLRRHRLSGFAKRLVNDVAARHPGSLWAEFTAIQREDIVYTLIPLHVRSPRRAKVLLNAFATTARLADARGVSWRDKPAMVAKLTVLQTEFPTFINSLRLEPRLVMHLERGESPGASASARLRDLYDDFVVRPDKPATDPDDDAAPSPLIGDGTADGREIDQARAVLKSQLHDYLEKARAAGVEGPTRQLLHLEPAGQEDGLTDPTLSEALDDAADRAPNVTLDQFETSTEDDIQIGVGILAAEVDEQVGQGRLAVVEVACRLMERLDRERLAALAPAVAPTVLRVVGEAGTPPMILGALALAIEQPDSSAAELVLERLNALIHDEHVHPDELRLDQIADLRSRMGPDLSAAAEITLVEGVGRGADAGVLRIIETGTSRDLPGFWSAKGEAIYDLAGTSEPAEDAEPQVLVPDGYTRIVRALVDRGGDARSVLAAALTIAIDRTEDSEYISEYTSGFEPPLTNSEVTLALRSLELAQLNDWGGWLALLSYFPRSQPRINHAEHVQRALQHLVNETSLGEPAHVEILSTAPATLTALVNPDIVMSIELQPLLTTDLTFDDEDSKVRRTVHEFAANFDAAEQIDEWAVTSIVDVLSHPYDDDLAHLDTYITDVISGEAAKILLARLRDNFGSAPTTLPALRALTATQARTDDVQPIDAAAYDTLRGLDQRMADTDWLTSRPPIGEVIARIDTTAPFSRTTLVDYAVHEDPSDRYKLWDALADAGSPDSLLAAVAKTGVPAGPAESHFRTAELGTNLAERSGAVERLVTLPLGSADLIGRSTDLILALLDSLANNNVKLAAAIALRSGAEPGRIRKVKGRFDTRSGGLSRGERKRLYGAGLHSKPGLFG